MIRMKITIISIILLNFSPIYVTSIDILTKSDSLNINKTLISKDGKFELGFFSKGFPKKYYVGIWYKDIISSEKIIIWVANRNSPSFSDFSVLILGNYSNILLSDGGSDIIWETHRLNGSNPVLQLLDSGNLVLRESGDSNLNNFVWQSFDYPTDTLVPGQKLGWNLKTGMNRFLSSWESRDDPSTGNYTFNLDYHGDPEIYLRNGGEIIYRSGPWVGQRFSGVPEMKTGNASDINFIFYKGPDEVYYKFEIPPNEKVKSRLTVNFNGVLERWTWVPETNQWIKYWYSMKDQCDTYKVCGHYGICNVSALLVCHCPRGFEPKDQVAWELRDGSSGCVRKTILDCKSDGFLKLENMKLSVTLNAYVNKNLNIKQCRDLCMRNCSCTGYADSEFVKGVGSGCVFWSDYLDDMRDYVEGGQPIYIRLAASDLAPNDDDKSKKVKMGVGISILVAIIFAGLVTLMVLCKRKNPRNFNPIVTRGSTAEMSQQILLNGQLITSIREYSGEASNADDFDLPLLDLYTLAIATDNFSDANKLGRGGFGLVYKGVMIDGQKIAVKRLSKESGQGAEEFKNEVKLIAKLQHRNLVRLLGCCVEMDEKMLIYEYLENRSLDSILYDKERCSLLDWQTRFNIVCGITRGLVYLHQDSRYRIIHRDLKASNVLLDGDMNPKISDFGMARIFGGDETEGNTMRVVGTYGYMAPEYAMDGIFSVKSDVFSFGVLVIEILTGIKNRGFYTSDQELNLLGYSWKQWREGKGMEILDKSMEDRYSIDEVTRCLQVGLLCVQERPEDRPTMGAVVLMLSSESGYLPQPKLPGFCLGWKPNETSSFSGYNKLDESFTVNQVTVSVVNAR
ncbi:hypothetical protein RND81_06G121600 [Saponaria officinalis]|uniref:Receptor-like serine/threonine-protein kinase n=1 Tax=Saponaria officinalis TaxID=3572 RepID=A0AAW1K9N9_SAPOF